MDNTELVQKIGKLTPEQQNCIENLVLIMASNGDEWIPVKNAASILGVSSMTIRRKIEEGVIRYRKNSTRKTLVSLVDIANLKN